jgi:hypothetical protein
MADDFATNASGQVLSRTFRARDIGTGVIASKQDVAPWLPTLVAGAQYAVSVTTGTIITLTVPSGATHAFVTVGVADVRYTEDNSPPTTGTTGNGQLLKDGFVGELPILTAMKFIAVTATAQLNVSYRKYI